MKKSTWFNLLQYLSVLILSIGMFSACGVVSGRTRGSVYPNMYSQSPTSILIMPPINETDHVDAQDYFYSTILSGLAERGYYVFSPYLSLELLREESAADAEMFVDGSLKPFRDVFGADAVLFTTIKRWEKSVLSSEITVEVEYLIKSTSTHDQLFRRSAAMTVDTSVMKVSGLGSLGGLVSVAANALATAATDKVLAARKANAWILQDLPAGKYRAREYQKDQKTAVGAEHTVAVVVR